jgi:type I restriction enzyme M protein
MFYNTGIGTYVWIVTNRKEKRRKGKIQLVDAREIWSAGGSLGTTSAASETSGGT